MRIWEGLPFPLGATYDGLGTNFSVFSEPAECVELCLFDPDGGERRVELTEVTGFCWHSSRRLGRSHVRGRSGKGWGRSASRFAAVSTWGKSISLGEMWGEWPFTLERAWQRWQRPEKSSYPAPCTMPNSDPGIFSKIVEPTL